MGMMKLTDRYLPYRKYELIIPVFLGCLGALIMSAFLMKRIEHACSPVEENQALAQDLKKSADIEAVNFFFQTRTERRNLIAELYRNAETQDWVVNFFAGVCASPEIARVILDGAVSFDISPSLAFALAWEESRLDPSAVNSHNRDGSVDRGLFQLNNHSFPRLESYAFFNPEINTRHGMGHLRHCLDVGGSEIAALAMYNAGTNRVNSSGTPRSTLDYISRIMENRWKIEALFFEQEALIQGQLDNFAEVAEVVPRPRLVPLMPLAGFK